MYGHVCSWLAFGVIPGKMLMAQLEKLKYITQEGRLVCNLSTGRLVSIGTASPGSIFPDYAVNSSYESSTMMKHLPITVKKACETNSESDKPVHLIQGLSFITELA